MNVNRRTVAGIPLSLLEFPENAKLLATPMLFGILWIPVLFAKLTVAAKPVIVQLRSAAVGMCFPAARLASVVRHPLHLHTPNWQLTNVLEISALGSRVALNAKILLEAPAIRRIVCGTNPRIPSFMTPNVTTAMRVSLKRHSSQQMLESVLSAPELLALSVKLNLAANGLQ